MSRSRARAWDGPMVAIAAVLTLIGSFGGYLVSKNNTSMIYEEKLATRPYVDERVVEVKRYVDEKTAQALKEATDHSDMNRQAILLEMEKVSSKTNESLSRIDTTMTMWVRAVQSMRDEAYGSAKRKEK